MEAKLSKGGGPVATVLVQSGTLRVGDSVVIGHHYGKIRAMIDDKLKRVKEAPPSKPVEILGLSSVPQAGEEMFVVQDEKTARDIATVRGEKEKEKGRAGVRRVTLEDIHRQIEEGQLKELNLILKADVSGSAEAIKDSLSNLPAKDVKLRVIQQGIGDVNETDVILAMASSAIVIGFHVGITPQASATAEKEKIDIRLYNIIYKLTNDIRAAMEGLLEPHVEEVFMGRAEVRQVFKVSKVGVIAGCAVTKGKIVRSADIVRLLRNKEVLFEGKLQSLKRFKEDVKEVAEGFECGIGLPNFKNFRQGDIIETYEIKKTARRLT